MFLLTSPTGLGLAEEVVNLLLQPCLTTALGPTGWCLRRTPLRLTWLLGLFFASAELTQERASQEKDHNHDLNPIDVGEEWRNRQHGKSGRKVNCSRQEKVELFGDLRVRSGRTRTGNRISHIGIRLDVAQSVVVHNA